MKKKISQLIAYVFAIFIIAFLILMFTAITKWCVKEVWGKEPIQTEDYVVCAGQTLWDIAEENKKDGQDIREYVYELRKLNGIDDCIIYPGQVIKIIK